MRELTYNEAAVEAVAEEMRRNRVGRHVEDLGIAPHLFGDGFERGLVIRHFFHHPVLASRRKHIIGRLLG